MKLIGFVFGFLGFVTASQIFEGGVRHAGDFKLTIIGNTVAVVVWSLFAVVFKRSKNPTHRHNVLVYWIILPMVFYACGFGYGFYSLRR